MNKDISSWFLSLFNLVYIEYYTVDYNKKLFYPTEVSDVEQQIKRMEWKKTEEKNYKNNTKPTRNWTWHEFK